MQRTVLITGCSSGIGDATARAFLDEEWDVYATARNLDDLAALEAADCVTAALDVTDDEAVRRVVDRVASESGRIDCLVNNAGCAYLGPIEDVPVEKVHRQFDVNVYGPHRLARAVLPHMREAESGTIVNVSSFVGRLAIPTAGVYSGSKFALEAMSDALRAEVAPFGVDVVLVEPGTVDTRFDRRSERMIDELGRTAAYDKHYRVLDDWFALGEGGRPGSVSSDAVAAVILNAASSTDPASRYPVGIHAQVGNVARFAPDWIRDAIYQLVRTVTSSRLLP